MCYDFMTIALWVSTGMFIESHLGSVVFTFAIRHSEVTP